MIGVFKLSSCLMYVGVATRGLRSSEGYEADSGVLRAESWGFCCVVAMMEWSGGAMVEQVESLSDTLERE